MATIAYPIDDRQRAAARVAAVACLLPFALIVYTNFGLRAPFFAGGDPADMVRRIASGEHLFRLSVALDVVYGAGAVALVAALYVVLRPVNPLLALIAAIWRLVYAVTAVLLALNLLSVAALSTNPEFARLLGADPLHALVRLQSRGTFDQYYVGLAFWALAGTLFSWLWLKSRYIPAALAGFGLIASAWCAVCTFAYLIDPGFARTVNLWWFDSPMAIFELITSFWLLIKGLPKPREST